MAYFRAGHQSRRRQGSGGGRTASESDGAGGRPRRTDAAADRPAPQAAAAGGGRAAGRHQLRALAAAGFREVVMNCSWLAETLQAGLGDGRAWGVSIEYSSSPGRRSTPAAASSRPCRCSAPGRSCWSMATSGATLRRRRCACRPACSATCVLVPNPEHNPQGDFGLVDGRVEADAGRAYTYGGMAILTPELFAGCEPGRFPLAPMLREAARQGRISGQLHRGAGSMSGRPSDFMRCARGWAGLSRVRCQQGRLQVVGHPLQGRAHAQCRQLGHLQALVAAGIDPAKGSRSMSTLSARPW
jgi:N-acetyl-alpha-D-muramate 1-phosphate uridylyltransferase